MKALKYQLKNIRRDKLCILTFFLPIVVSLAINIMPGMNFSAANEIVFGVLKNNLPAVAVEWLQDNGNLTYYESMKDLKNAVNDPATSVIGVLRSKDGIKTMLSGDELQMTTAIGNTLSRLYAERDLVFKYKSTIVSQERDSDILKPLLIVITMVTAMFMGCTFNAMNIIAEKEDGIVYVNQVLPLKRAQYIVQKISLGFIGGALSTILTAAICIKIAAVQILPLILLVMLSTFVASVMGVFIGHFSSSLMIGIVYIKMVMILFLAPPILIYLLVPSGSIIHTISYILPSSATFYGLMDLLNGQLQNTSAYLIVLLLHCIAWFILFIKTAAFYKPSC